MAKKIGHGTVKVKRPWEEKARTVPRAMWEQAENNSFRKQKYELVTAAAEPIGVKPKPPKAVKPEQPEPNDGTD